MPSPQSLLTLLVVALILTGCHQTPPPTPQAAAPTPSVQPSKSSETERVTPPPTPARTVTHATPKHSTQDIGQLDLNSEGGVRDGNYAMWVHVTDGGRPVMNLPVIALNMANKPVAAARTNEDGDAMLKVQAIAYRITAKRGPSHAEQTVTFHPGDQFDLKLVR